MPKGYYVHPNPLDSVPMRFVEKVNITDTCWLWTGCKDIGGYGQIRLGRKQSIQAHRMSYLFYHGEIPQGKIIMHLCDNPPCVNPQHLKAGTTSQNIQHARDIKPYPRKEKCFRGHLYSGLDSSGWNHCKTCHNINATKWRLKHVKRDD